MDTWASESAQNLKHRVARSRNALAWILCLIYVVMAVLSLRHLSMTYDEDHFYAYGVRILHLNSDRNNPSVMPVTALNALPGRIANLVNISPIHEFLGKFDVARLPTIAVGLLLGLLCFRWSSELFGPVAGLVSLAVFAFEPNILAHTRLVTTDIYITFGFALVAYTVWLHDKRRSWKTLVGVGIALGYASVAKFTSILLYLLVPALLLVIQFRQVRSGSGPRGLVAYLKGALVSLGEFALVAIIGLMVINAAFLANGTLSMLSSYSFHSSAFESIQRLILGWVDVPVPFPRPYLNGLDTVLFNARTAHAGVASFYLLGTLNHTGFTGYYLIASLYKVPLGFQILLVVATVAFFVRSYRHGVEIKYVFVLLPLLVLTVYFNWINRYDKGIRHFLPAFPLAIVFVGSLFTTWKQWAKWQKGLAIALVVWGAASTLSYFPHFIAYFNELVPDRRYAYHVLADSNLDWGQSEWYLKTYAQEHPDAVIEPPGPTAGTVVVGANKLLGVIGTPDTFAWLRDNFEPVGTVAYSYLIFDVSPADLEALQP